MSKTNATEGRETYVHEPVPYDFGADLMLGNPALDGVVKCVVAMGAEMWSTKRRMLVLEALLEQKGISSETIDNYVPTSAQNEAWQLDRDRFLDLALSPLGDNSFRSISSGDNGFTKF
ncbi:hypothetical protein Q6D67_21150 [Haliea sp. E1-2-M8]|uniref:hypothetical protein n=1 Tax=Haliea sp. E1-2-M8 TaxID=3064706 RepID=UPI002724371B|nr:hypothetical protein [Haliea sp. E1-2-M8]MDO8864189.1 hypothetical protein [Haliea sp. E1-2-M8]